MTRMFFALVHCLLVVESTFADDSPKPFVVRDVSVFLQVHNEPRINSKQAVLSTLPAEIKSRRHHPTEPAPQTAQPVGLITFEGPEVRDAEVKVQLITADGMAHWPPAVTRSTRFLWPTIDLVLVAAGSSVVTDDHWLSRIQSEDRLKVRTKEYAEPCLLYDLALRRPSGEIALSTASEGFRLTLPDDLAVLDVSIFQPVGGDKWKVAYQKQVGIEEKNASEPGKQANLFDDVKPSSAEDDGDRAPGDNGHQITYLSTDPLSDQAAANVLLKPLRKAGLGDPELRYVESVLRVHALVPDEAVLVFRLTPSTIDRLVPLDVSPAPDRIVRVPVVIVRGVDPAIEQKIDGLIAQLGHRDWTKRESAQQELLSLGAAAKKKVEAALKHGDPEVVRRAELLMEDLKSNTPAQQGLFGGVINFGDL